MSAALKDPRELKEFLWTLTQDEVHQIFSEMVHHIATRALNETPMREIHRTVLPKSPSVVESLYLSHSFDPPSREALKTAHAQAFERTSQGLLEVQPARDLP